MRALVLHHDRNSTLGHLADLFAQRGIEVREHFICAEVGSPVAGGPLPDLGDAEMLVALGSRWSVYDGDSIGGWIRDELALLRNAHDRGVGVLGICFGGQALSAALGGEVTAGPYADIGWSLVDSDQPGIEPGPWFQWHFDVFTTPPGAVELATSRTGPQAFRIERSLGVQFHPELDPELLELWMLDDRQQLVDAHIDPDELVADTKRMSDAARARAATLLDWYLAEVLPS